MKQENKEIWEEIHSTRDWGKYPDIELVKFVCRNLLKNKNINILDLGCANGKNIKFLLQQGFTNVTGIDYSESTIKKANRFLGKTCCFVGDFRELNFDEKFDLIIDESSLQHNQMRDIKKVVNDCYELMNEGGYFFSEFVGQDKDLEKGYGYVHFIGYSEIKELFKNFKKVTIDRLEYTENNMKGRHFSWIIVGRK